jgi:hypothetical protein
MHINLPDSIAIIYFGFIGAVVGEIGLHLLQGYCDYNEMLV